MGTDFVKPAKPCVVEMYCSGLFVNLVLCDTLPAPGEPGLWDSSEELFTVVASQYHGQRERSDLRVHFN